MSGWDWLLVAVAGAVGAPARYLVDTWVTGRRPGLFPAGTLVVNLTGSLGLGLITGLALYHGLGAVPKEVAGTGLIGAYTTFSTFGLETLSLLEDGQGRAALTNVVVSLVAGALAAAAGLAIAGL